MIKKDLEYTSRAENCKRVDMGGISMTVKFKYLVAVSLQCGSRYVAKDSNL
jgi:hypothetical protein